MTNAEIDENLDDMIKICSELPRNDMHPTNVLISYVAMFLAEIAKRMPNREVEISEPPRSYGTYKG